MIYNAYEMARTLTRPMSFLLKTTGDIARHELNPMRNMLPNRIVSTLCEVPYRALKTYPKLPFNVERHDDDTAHYSATHGPVATVC